MLEFDDAAVDPEACVRQATRFDASTFRRELMRQVELAGGPVARLDGGDLPLLASTRAVQPAVRDPNG